MSTAKSTPANEGLQLVPNPQTTQCSTVPARLPADHFEEWAATPERPGINYIDPVSFSPAAVQQQLAQARAAGADLTIVAIHWGSNWRWRPPRSIQRLAHVFVDSGADVVFGHSSHHIQGIEIYKGRPILYGSGGCVGGHAIRPRRAAVQCGCAPNPAAPA